MVLVFTLTNCGHERGRGREREREVDIKNLALSGRVAAT
jgi:hypothetical protein